MLGLSTLETFISGKTEMMIRSSKKEANGDIKDSQAIDNEWEGGSASNLMVLNIDCFTKV